MHYIKLNEMYEVTSKTSYYISFCLFFPSALLLKQINISSCPRPSLQGPCYNQTRGNFPRDSKTPKMKDLFFSFEVTTAFCHIFVANALVMVSFIFFFLCNVVGGDPELPERERVGLTTGLLSQNSPNEECFRNGITSLQPQRT